MSRFDAMHIAAWLIEESNALDASMRQKLVEEEAARLAMMRAKTAVRAAKKAANEDDASLTAIAAAEALRAAAEEAFVLRGDEYTVLFNDAVFKGEELQAVAADAGMTTQDVYAIYNRGENAAASAAPRFSRRRRGVSASSSYD
jgi:hypothetical protein